MRRLSRVDRLLLWTLTPLWIACVFLHLDRQLADRPLAWVPVYVAPGAGPQGEPVVTGYWPETPPAEQELRAGDRLVQVGGEPLGDPGWIGFWARVFAHAPPDLAVPVTAVRQGERVEASLHLRPVSFPWRTVPLSLALGLSALLALARGRGSPAARAYALGALAYSVQWSFFFGGAPWQTRAGLAAFFAAGALYQPLTLRAALRFPEDVAVRARWPYRAAWLFSLTALGLWAWLFGSPLSGEAGLRLLGLSYGSWIAVFLAILARQYARADARGRRQLKWVLYGFSVGLGPVLVGAAVFGARPQWRFVYELSLCATVFIPICLYIAFLRYNLFDINRLITTTIAYSLLGPAVLGLLFTAGPPAAEWLGGAVGVQRLTALWLLAVALAAPVPFLAGRLRPWLERLLFREQFRLEQGLRALRRDVGGFDGPGELLRGVGERLAGLLRLHGLALYARADDTFALVHAHGGVFPPAFDARGTLAALLGEARAPVDAAHLRRWLALPAVAPAERAAMQSLDPELLVPLQREEALGGFLCLGEKQSGDVFTRAEQALLESLAERVAARLDQFDEAQVAREQRALYERIASYAPGSIREELTRGAPPEPGEREVSVLFVDVRGYTALAEGRQAAEIFRLVNAYTAAVSKVVRDHGGAVVEFHGDGLMAVFNAPGELPDKERCAVEAARAVAKAARGGELGDERISVGVGIATGPGFVGDIQSVDRKIWGVIGNTTNLAARLEALTRPLDAWIVVDAPTHERAGPSATGFAAHPDVKVKGRSEPLTVWALPREG